MTPILPLLCGVTKRIKVFSLTTRLSSPNAGAIRRRLVFLSQSLSSFYAALGHAGKHKVDSLMANFTHAIIHACDPITAEWAVSRIGKAITSYCGSSLAPMDNLYDEIMGYQKITTNMSEHKDQILESNVFMNGLRCGGPINHFICDAVVLKSAESFANNGQNFLPVAFSQKG